MKVKHEHSNKAKIIQKVTQGQCALPFLPLNLGLFLSRYYLLRFSYSKHFLYMHTLACVYINMYVYMHFYTFQPEHIC